MSHAKEIYENFGTMKSDLCSDPLSCPCAVTLQEKEVEDSMFQVYVMLD